MINSRKLDFMVTLNGIKTVRFPGTPDEPELYVKKGLVWYYIDDNGDVYRNEPYSTIEIAKLVDNAINGGAKWSIIGETLIIGYTDSKPVWNESESRWE